MTVWNIEKSSAITCNNVFAQGYFGNNICGRIVERGLNSSTGFDMQNEAEIYRN